MKIENVRNGCNNENVPLGVCSANSKLRGIRLSTEKKTCKAIRSSPETLDPEPSTDTCETGSYIKPDVYFGVTASPCLVFPAGSRLLLN